LVWVSGYIFGVKYAHKLVIFFKAGDVIKLAILSIFVFLFHYIRVLDNQKIFRVLSAMSFVGIDQVAELSEIRIHQDFVTFASFEYTQK